MAIFLTIINRGKFDQQKEQWQQHSQRKKRAKHLQIYFVKSYVSENGKW